MKHRAEMAHLGSNCTELLVMQKKLQVGVIVAVNLLATGELTTDATLLGY